MGFGSEENALMDDGLGSWRNISFHVESAEAEKMDSSCLCRSDLKARVNVNYKTDNYTATHR